MAVDRGQSRAAPGVRVQDAGDQIPSVAPDHPVRECVRVRLDLPVGQLHIRRLKRRFAYQQGVQDHAERPDVDLEAVPSAAQDLGCDVVRRSCDLSFLLAIVHELHSKPEVPNLQVHVLVDEEVAQLQVTVHHVLAVKKGQTVQQLLLIELCLGLRQPLPLRHEVHQISPVTQLQSNVDVVTILEPGIEGDDVGVRFPLRDVLMYLYLSVQHLAHDE